MVNGANSRSQYPLRQSSWYPGKTGSDYYPEDGRFGGGESLEMRNRPWSINKALTELCGIPGTTFFVAAEENGKVVCLSTPVGSTQLDYERFFNKAAFHQEVDRLHQGPITNQPFDNPNLNFNPDMDIDVPETSTPRLTDRHPTSNTGVDDSIHDGSRRPKKRARAHSRQPGTAASRQDNMPMVTIQSKRGVKIGDSDAVHAFYDHRLRSCQQTACKIIAKSWVKAVAPKKQSTHPYTGGDKTRPDWWPKKYCRFGENEYKDLRHKEPDHLGKEERVFLLCYLLRMLVEPPQRQHHAIRKLNIDLDTLEANTYEALSTWFSDKDCPGNLNKKPFLREIFKVAKLEARYKKGEIDANTEILIMPVSADEARRAMCSDSDDEGGFDQRFAPDSTGQSPEESNGIQMMMSQIQVSENGETGHFPGNGFPGSVPIRATHYSHPGFEPGLAERPNYVEAHGIANHAPNYSQGHLGLPEVYPSPQGSSRRSSVFNSPPEYGSPATPVVYSPWSTPTPTNNTSLYGFQPQPPAVQAFAGQVTTSPPYGSQTLDGLPRQHVDAQHGEAFSTRGVSQGTMHHQPAYPNYVPDGSPVLGQNVKAEGSNCHPLPH